jgi:hypothetical protein
MLQARYGCAGLDVRQKFLAERMAEDSHHRAVGAATELPHGCRPCRSRAFDLAIAVPPGRRRASCDVFTTEMKD